MSERPERIARNEATSREINENIEEAQQRSEKPISHRLRVWPKRLLTPDRDPDPRYEAVRSAPAHFAVVKGHEVPDVESVVVETDRFFVVRKREGVAADIAEKEDPRP